VEEPQAFETPRRADAGTGARRVVPGDRRPPAGRRPGLHGSASSPPWWGMKVHEARVAEPRDGVERVWREDGPRLWRSLVAFGGDPELASDAMAEAFAQALGRGSAIESPDRWVWRAALPAS